MSYEVVFDIETKNTFQDVGAYDASLLSVSFVGAYRSDTGEYLSYFEEDLPKLWPLLEHADRLIGYNSLSFDIPCLNRYYAGDLKKIPHLDLLKKIEVSLGFRCKLDDVAKSTLGVGKTGHGLDAVKYWNNGELDKLKKYCLDDVRITKDLYEYGKKNGHVKLVDRVGVSRELVVDFSMPEHTDKKVSLTLGI